MCHGSAIWLPFVQPFGTVLVGVAASFLASRQWLTANAKLSLDLYDKRSKWLDDATKDYIELFRHGVQDQDSLRGLHYNLGRLETVFPADVRSRVNAVRTDVGTLIGVRETASNADRVDDTFARIINAMPSLQTAALEAMQINVPTLPWIRKRRD